MPIFGFAPSRKKRYQPPSPRASNPFLSHTGVRCPTFIT
jgi:hypothetical protein